jgi:hypothetical protein
MDVCVRVYSVFLLSCVQVAALRRADHSSRESHRLCKYVRIRNWTRSQGRTKGCRDIDKWMNEWMNEWTTYIITISIYLFCKFFCLLGLFCFINLDYRLIRMTFPVINTDYRGFTLYTFVYIPLLPCLSFCVICTDASVLCIIWCHS